MTIKKDKISFEITGQFSKLFIDYINRSKDLKEFYDYEPSLDSFELLINSKSSPNVNRELLVSVITEQYKSQGLETVNIKKLLDSNTFTVCTGHQLCLFTGPLYFIYKIISTINLSEKLKEKYLDYNFVPVYWMASEDHDFEEVSSINVFGKNIKWNYHEAKGAVGLYKTDAVSESIEELKRILGDSSYSLIEIFKEAYLKKSNLASATRYIVNELFGKYGLVIVDGNDAALKKSFSAIIKDDIINNINYDLVNKSIKRLENLGYKAQVNPREINCFYIKENIRERIEKTLKSPLEGGKGDEFQILNINIKFTKEQIIEEIENYPEYFSPNVVLRPMYQQFILPNIAYVGGPGELAYWLEYKAMFDYHKICFPILIPRNFALISDEKTNQQIQNLGFKFDDIFDDTENLKKRYVQENTLNNINLNEELSQVESIYNALVNKAKEIDKTLEKFVESEKQKAINSIKNIESKLLKAEKQNHETALNQIKKIKERFLPNGVLQERNDNISQYYMLGGNEFIQNLKNTFDPFEFEMLILTIDN